MRKVFIYSFFEFTNTDMPFFPFRSVSSVKSFPSAKSTQKVVECSVVVFSKERFLYFNLHLSCIVYFYQRKIRMFHSESDSCVSPGERPLLQCDYTRKKMRLKSKLKGTCNLSNPFMSWFSFPLIIIKPNFLSINSARNLISFFSYSSPPFLTK